MEIDVIIPTYKPDKAALSELLAALNEQTIKPNKISIINTDSRYLQENDYAGISNVYISHIALEEFDHAATRNKAITMSDSEFVILMTQDAMPVNNRLIEELLMPFKDEKVALTYARQIPKSDCNIIEQYTRFFNYPDKDIVKTKEDIETMGIKAYFCSDVCAAYRVSIYHELGGFVKKAIFNEDSLYAAKAVQAGYKVYYASKALIRHSHNYSNMQYFHRNFDLGVSHREHAEIFDAVKSEDEGVKLVLDTMKYLIKKNKWCMIPKLIISSSFKYMGYKLGKRYDKLPKGTVLKCTMSKRYWEAK